MVYTGVFCTEAEIIAKEGENVSSNVTEAMHNDWMDQVQAYINVLTRFNWRENYGALEGDVKALLAEASSNLCAIYGISYDMSGYTSRIEAENMINILAMRFNDCIELLRDQKSVTFIKTECGLC